MTVNLTESNKDYAIFLPSISTFYNNVISKYRKDGDDFISPDRIPALFEHGVDGMDFLKQKIRTIPDFPKKGIQFRDITTLLADPEAFNSVIDLFYEHYLKEKIDLVVGIESRGFIVGSPLALRLEKGFIPVRKAGKLPGPTHGIEYELEYGTDLVEVHKDAIEPGSRVLMVDDLLATGDIPAVRNGRGGQWTYHGPGQRIAPHVNVFALQAGRGHEHPQLVIPERLLGRLFYLVGSRAHALGQREVPRCIGHLSH